MCLLMKPPRPASAPPSILPFPASGLMTVYRIIGLAVCAALAACAQQPPQTAEETSPAPQAVVVKPQPQRHPLPGVELSEELLYKMMLAEVALQRGQAH